MNKLEKLRAINPHIAIHTLDESCAKKFATVLDIPSSKEIIGLARKITPIPEQGNTYVASLSQFEELPVRKTFEPVFAGMPIQMGYCNGRGNHLGGMEWHFCPEGTIMVTDAVFFWATQEELEENHFDSRKAMAFFVPEGTCFFLKPMVLHLAPSATDKNGFRSIIILEKGTNTPLGELDGSNEPQREVLFMKNKWMIAHPENANLVGKGVHPYVEGPNWEIHPVEGL